MTWALDDAPLGLASFFLENIKLGWKYLAHKRTSLLQAAVKKFYDTNKNLEKVFFSSKSWDLRGCQKKLVETFDWQIQRPPPQCSTFKIKIYF